MEHNQKPSAVDKRVLILESDVTIKKSSIAQSKSSRADSGIEDSIKKSSIAQSKSSRADSGIEDSPSLLEQGAAKKKPSGESFITPAKNKRAVSFHTCVSSKSESNLSSRSYKDCETHVSQNNDKTTGNDTDELKKVFEKSDIDFEKSLKRYQDRIIERRSIPWMKRRKQKWTGFDKDDIVVAQIDEWYRERFSKSSYIQENKNPPRDEWAGKWDFSLSILGYMVGTGNLRFALLVITYGGITFIIPQLVCMCIMGYPVMLMEISLGQYTSLGPTASWNFCKLLQGLGYASVYISFLEGIVYTRTLSYVLHYAFASFSEPWNDNNVTHDATQVFDKMKVYYNDFVVHDHEEKDKHSGTESEEHHDSDDHHHAEEGAFHNFSDLDGSLVVCLLAVWTALMLALINGIPTAGKIVKWTATLPLLCLVIFFVLTFTLPGAVDGIAFGMTPRPEKLGYLKTWVETAEFVFYSMSVSYGGHTALASYNTFHAPVLTNTFIAACGDMLIGWLCAFLFFALFGSLAHTQGLSPQDLDFTDENIIFTLYPTVFNEIGGFWNVFFFLTVILLGIDVSIFLVEAVITSIIDTFKLNSSERKYVVMSVTLVSFLLSIPLITGSGTELSVIYNNFHHNLLLVGLCQCLAIGWAYGAERFIDEVEFMVGWDVTFLLSYEKCKIWWVICWKYLAPAMIAVLLIDIYFVDPHYADSDWPAWARYLFFMNGIAGNVIIVATVVVLMFNSKGSLTERYRALRLPNNAWGPASDYHRKMVRILEISKIDKTSEKESNINTRRDKRFLKNINI